MKDPLKYFDNNTGGMITLLEAMNQFGIKKIVFSSTAATYGEPKRVPSRKPIRKCRLIHMVKVSWPWKDHALG